MSLLRLILALPFALFALHQAVGEIGATQATATTTKPAARWPWVPKGGTKGWTAAARQETSIRSTTPEPAWSYDWPLKPFDRPHPVRAYLNDPRVSRTGTQHSFHFGVDISAQGGTPVYAIEAGTAFRMSAQTVVVRSGARAFEYWHLDPAIRDGQRVRRHTLLGQTRLIFNHLHLSERLRGVYVNPLRAGGLGPFADFTSPRIVRVSFRRAGHRYRPSSVHGVVDVVADSFDIASDVKPTPWPVTPALLRWRILHGDGVVTDWQTALDFRSRVLSRSRFAAVYAGGTRMNHPGWAGYYCFYLAHGWHSTSLPNGTYRLEVSASDIRGNAGLSTFDFTVAN
jgi:hypothetical protein